MTLYAKWAKIEKPDTPETSYNPNNSEQLIIDNTQKPSQSSNAVQTGDNTNRILYTGGLIASLGVVICVCMSVKKKKIK